MGRIKHISKKAMAVAFAVMLAVASISIAAFANQSDPYVNAEITAKWLVLDETTNTYVDAIEDKTPDTDHGENQSINAEYARPGDSVRADIYFQSDTPVDNISLLYTFDEDLLEVDWTKFNRNGNVYYLTGYNGYTGSAAPGKPALTQILSDNADIIPEDVTFEGLDAISISGYCGQFKDYTNPTLITSIFFTVKSSATVKPGSGPAVVTVPEYTYFTSDLNDLGFNTSYMINVEDPLEPGESLDSSFLNLTLVNNSQQLLFGGDVNFNAVEGYGTIGTGTAATVNGYYGDPLQSTDIPDVTPKDGYVLIGWSTSLANGNQTDGDGNTVLGGKYSDMVIDYDDLQTEYTDITFSGSASAPTLYAVYACAPADYTVNVYTQKLGADGQPVDEYELYGDSHELSGRAFDEVKLSDINEDWLPDENGFEFASTDPDGQLVLGTDESENVFSVYYDRKPYTITWKISADDEAPVGTATVYYGADAGTANYDDPDVPAFLGYTGSERFGSKVTGWSDHEFLCADDILVTAELSPVDVTVKYHSADKDGNEGSFENSGDVFEFTAAYGDTIGSADFTDTLNPPTGYHFADNAAVYTNSAGTQTAVTDLGALPDTLDKSGYYCLNTSGDTIIIDIYPQFEINTGDITFDPNGGAFPVDGLRVDSYQYGQTVYEPGVSDFAALKSETDESGVESYYTFAGWGEASDSTTTVSVDSTFTEDKTYYAVWEDNRITITFIGKDDETIYTIKRNLDNGSYALDENDYPDYSAIPLVDAEDWIWDVETGAMLTSNIVITGHSEYQFGYYWKDSNGRDNSTNTVYLAEGEALPANLLPAVTGYEFKGWYSDYRYNNLFCLAGDEADCLMPGYPLTLYGYYEAIEYTATYYTEADDTEAYETFAPLYYGNAIPLPEAPVKTGNSFDGWVYYNLDDQGEVTGVYEGTAMPANDVKAVAKWKIHTFTIDFDSNGGSDVDDITAAYEASITWPDDPEKEGYTFIDWHVDTVNGSVYTDTPDTMPLIGETDGATLKLVAEWRINTHTISYDFDDDQDTPASFKNTDDHPDSLDYGQPLPDPEAVRDGYTFVDWAYYTVDEDGGTNIYTGETMPDFDVILEALWLVNSYTIEFDSNGGSDVDDITADYRESITWPDNPEKEGYTFVNWHVDSVNGDVYSDRPVAMPLIGEENGATLKLVAEWSVNEYSIIYDLNDKETSRAAFSNDGDHPGELDYGQALPAPVLARNGYAFTEWVYYNLDEQGEVTGVYNGDTMPANDIKAVASWTPYNFTIDFDSNGGSDVADITADYESDIVWPANPRKEGYSFMNWHIGSEGGAVYSDRPASMPLIGTENGATLTLVAEWNINAYHVSYDFNVDPDDPDQPSFANENDHPGAVTYNTALPDPEAVRTGWVFDGWVAEYNDGTDDFTLDVESDKMPAYPVSYKALWTIGEFTVHYIVTEDEQQNEDVDIIYRDIIEDCEPQDPELEGYTFDGWEYYTDSSFGNAYDGEEMPDYELYAKAILSINSYNLTYDANTDDTVTGMPANTTVTYGYTIPEAGELTRDMYRFDGWVYTYIDGDGDTQTVNEGDPMPAYNVTATAQWTAKHTVHFIYNIGAGTLDDEVGTKVFAEGEAINHAGITSPEYADGYTFKGWNTDRDATSSLTAYGNMGTDDVYLYAVWGVGEYRYHIRTYTMNTDGTYSADSYDEVIDAKLVDTPVSATPAPEAIPYGFYLDTGYAGNGTDLPAYSDEGVVPAQSDALVLSIYIARVQSDIIYDVDGGSQVAAAEDVCYGAAFPEAVTSREGYTFVKWNYYEEAAHTTPVTGGTMPAQDVYALAQWSVNKYDVTYDLSDDAVETAAFVNTDDHPVKVDYGTALPAPEIARRGYIFNGWSVTYTDSENAQHELDLSSDTMPAYAVTYKAEWDPYNYTIDFDSNGGSEVYDIVEEYRESITWPDNPVREGYTFIAWHKGTESGAVYNPVYAMPYLGENGTVLKLVAEWRINSYRVTYDFDVDAEDPDQASFANMGDHPEAVVYGGVLPNPVAVRNGYVFDGWNYYNLDENNTVTGEYTGAAMPANNIKAVAGWSPFAYTIDFDSNGGSEVEDITAAYGAEIDWPANPVLEGYDFMAWHVSTVNGETYSPVSEMPYLGENGTVLKLVAEWKINDYAVIYEFDDDPASTAAFKNTDDHPDSVTYGAVIPDPVLEREGYTFNGWTVTYTDGEQNEQTLTAGESVMPAYTVIYTAKWLADPVITYYADETDKANGVAYNTFTVKYGDIITADMIPADPTRTGHTFGGWEPDLTGMAITQDTEVVGSFSAIEYKLYTIVPLDRTQDGETEIPYGSVIAENMPDDPEVEEYMFTGWIYYTDESAADDYLYTGETMPDYAIYAVAQMEEIPEVIVKLVPINQNSTAMIERGGVVETFNADILNGSLRAPRGVTTRRTADEETYDYERYEEDAADYNSWYIYGLRSGLTTNGLAEYITVTNGGHYVIEGAYRGRIATGTVIKVYDAEGNFKEQFRAVIYGDINGDGVITGTDLQKADYEVVTKTFSSNTGKVETPYLFRAADLNQDGNFTGIDDQRFNEVVPGIRVINQASGRADPKS